MRAPARQSLALLTLAGLWACADPPTLASPNADAAAGVGASVNPGPPDLGLVGRLGGIGDLLQVQDARLTALGAAWREADPPEPDRALIAALVDIRTAAMSLAHRVDELERLMGTTLPAAPVKPPNPNVPPSPCQAGNHAFPPNPCYAGQLGSIARVLGAADGRMAVVEAGFVPPPDADLPAVQDALAIIWMEAMNLARNAEGMLALING